MILSSIFRFIHYNAINIFIDGFYSAFSLYLCFFGILLFAAEYKYANMIKYFEFLVTDLGKAVFMIFIGVLLFDNSKKGDMWASLTLTMFGLINLVLLCAGRGRTEEKRKENDEEENESLINQSEHDLETMSEKQGREEEE
jgi:hypothetical protein